MLDKKQIQQLAQERIDELNSGLFIVEIHISPSNHILVEVEKESGSVSIEECVSVSRNVEHNLDREVEDFSLEVSSPGLDKPFKVPQQYIKNIGRELKLKVGGEKLQGELLEANAEGIVLQTSEKKRVEGKKKKITEVIEHKLSYQDIDEAKVVITFK